MHCINIVIVDKENLQIITESIPNIHSVKLADNNNKEFFAIPNGEFNKDVLVEYDFDDDFCGDFDDENCGEFDDNFKNIDTINPLDELNVSYVIAFTDYFGGAGEQSAVLVKGGEVIQCERINDAVLALGVVKNIKDNEDEFDTINLGKYRSNSDFYE